MANVYDQIANDPKYSWTFKELANTTLNNTLFFTTDDSLMGVDGRTKVIRRYSSNGNPFQVVPEGQTISNFQQFDYDSVEYTVDEILGGAKYTSTAALDMRDIGNMHQRVLQESLKQYTTAKTIDEWYKIRNYKKLTGTQTVNFDTVVEALAELNFEQGEIESKGLAMYVNPTTYATLQKECKDLFKYVEKFGERGAVGLLGGIPVVKIKVVKFVDLATNTEITSKIEDGNAIIAPRSAVVYFKKEDFRLKDTETADMGEHQIYVRGAGLIALYEDKDSIIIAPELPNTYTVSITNTTLSNAKVSGAAPTGSIVEVYVDGEKVETVVAASNAFETTKTYSAAAGKIVSIKVTLRGYAPETESVTLQ